jgi:hypothetical protein
VADQRGSENLFQDSFTVSRWSVKDVHWGVKTAPEVLLRERGGHPSLIRDDPSRQVQEVAGDAR